jgi:hypothetical protein
MSSRFESAAKESNLDNCPGKYTPYQCLNHCLDGLRAEGDSFRITPKSSALFTTDSLIGMPLQMNTTVEYAAKLSWANKDELQAIRTQFGMQYAIKIRVYRQHQLEILERRL